MVVCDPIIGVIPTLPRQQQKVRVMNATKLTEMLRDTDFYPVMSPKTQMSLQGGF